MSEKKKNGKPGKTVRVGFGFSWFYIILIISIGFMLFRQPSANPQKIEWAEVEDMILEGDVKEIEFVRNDFKGEITVRPECLEKYADMFGGVVPARSPHFVFMVSNKFDPETRFGELNAQLPEDNQFKVILVNDDKIWGQVLEWLIFPILLILMWVWMFRGLGRNNAAGGGGMNGVQCRQVDRKTG